MNLKTISDYAELCGVSKTVIYKRIEKKEIKVSVMKGVKVIDASLYKLEGRRAPGRRRLFEKR
jgi:hypothetical protein